MQIVARIFMSQFLLIVSMLPGERSPRKNRAALRDIGYAETG
jgi:hypothetical protein